MASSDAVTSLQRGGALNEGGVNWLKRLMIMALLMERRHVAVRRNGSHAGIYVGGVPAICGRRPDHAVRKTKNAFLALLRSDIGTNSTITSACDVIFAARSLDAHELARRARRRPGHEVLKLPIPIRPA